MIMKKCDNKIRDKVTYEKEHKESHFCYLFRK